MITGGDGYRRFERNNSRFNGNFEQLKEPTTFYGRLFIDFGNNYYFR